MKNYKKLFGILTLVALIATIAAPQAQGKKRSQKEQMAIEKILMDGNKYYDEGNFEAAIECYKALDKQGDIRGTHNLGVCYAEGKGVEKSLTQAFKLYEKGAKKGYVDSQVALGEMYKNGYGCKQDYKAAIKWLEKAAKQNDSDAMYLIGTCYYYGGYGIKKDIQKAKEWIGRSAALGNETAIDNLPKIK